MHEELITPETSYTIEPDEDDNQKNNGFVVFLRDGDMFILAASGIQGFTAKQTLSLHLALREILTGEPTTNPERAYVDPRDRPERAAEEDDDAPSDEGSPRVEDPPSKPKRSARSRSRSRKRKAPLDRGKDTKESPPDTDSEAPA